jgi:pimeloyl-ACP methyl ester carboxylesterase
MSKQITFQNSRIAYKVYGEGKPVMLVHGFGEDSKVWQQQVDYLKDKFRLIIPDLPGTAGSEIIGDMSMEGMAEVLNAILLEEKISTCSVIGHSMGGYILLAFAAKYAEKLDRFGLFHSSAFADSDEKKETRKKGIAFIREQGAYAFLKTATPNLFSPKTKAERPEIIEQQVEEGHNFLPQVLVSYYEAMMKRPDRTDILKQATVPVLFIMGKFDQAVPLEDGLKQCHLPEISYIHTLQESGHMGMLEETEKSNRILESFLTEI